MVSNILENPPWAAKTLKLNWKLLKRNAYKGAMPKRHSDEELGCGFFGCVYATNKKGIVLKLTKDRNEAALVDYLVKHPLPGILKHYKIIKLNVSEADLDEVELSRTVNQADGGYRVLAGPIWAIWREEVKNVGMMASWHQVGFHKLLHVNKRIFWLDRSGRITKKTMTKIWKIIRSGVFTNPKSKKPRLTEVEKLLISSYFTMLFLSKQKVTKMVGQALLKMFKKGVLITDLHMNNLSWTKRGLVISDPGEVVYLPGSIIKKPIKLKLPGHYSHYNYK